MTIEEQAGLVKLASPKLAGTTGELRDQALLAVAKALMDNKEAIFDANRQDMEQAEKDGIAAPVLKRLKFDEGKLRDVIMVFMIWCRCRIHCSRRSLPESSMRDLPCTVRHVRSV